MNEYSPFKAAHHPEILRGMREGKAAAPTHVQIYPSDLCNEDCSFCAFRMEGYTVNKLFGVEEDAGRNNNPNRMIPDQKLQEIIQDCHTMGVQAVQFTGGGEPSLHPLLPLALRMARQYGMSTAVVSNGVKWSEALKEELTQCAWVRVSVDAGTGETYASMRHVPRAYFQRVLANIKDLRTRAPALNLGVSFVVTKENWREIIQFGWKMAELGVSNIRYSGVFQPHHAEYFKEFYTEAQRDIHLAREAVGHLVQVFNLFGDRVQDLVDESPNYERCGFQFFTTVIGGDMNVYRCCNTAYNEQGLLGSVASQGFKDFWFSPETQAKLHGFDARGCERCMFNSKNRFINYLAEDKPAHSEFV